MQTVESWQPQSEVETMTSEPDRVNVQVGVDREVLAEVDRLATLWDMYRYEVVEELLRLALERVKQLDYKPRPKQ
jgi:hypothetical protein